MLNFNSRRCFLASAACIGLVWAAAGARLAAEQVGTAPDFSSNDAAWVFGRFPHISCAGSEASSDIAS